MIRFGGNCEKGATTDITTHVPSIWAMTYEPYFG